MVSRKLGHKLVAIVHICRIPNHSILNIVLLHPSSKRTLPRRVRQQGQDPRKHRLVFGNRHGHQIRLLLRHLVRSAFGHPIQVPQRNRLRQYEPHDHIRGKLARTSGCSVLRCVLNPIEAKGAGRVKDQHENLFRIRWVVHSGVPVARAHRATLHGQRDIRTSVDPQSAVHHPGQLRHHVHFRFLLGQGHASNVAVDRHCRTQRDHPASHGGRFRLQGKTNDRPVLVRCSADMLLVLHRQQERRRRKREPGPRSNELGYNNNLYSMTELFLFLSTTHNL